MKNLKLKLTMIVTIITILMINVAVFATTDMEANVEGKKVEVSVNIDSNIEEAYFELEYNDNVYNYVSSSAGEYANVKNGKVRVQVGTAELKANNYSVTFTFEYTGEDKTNTSAFTVSNIDFTNKDGEPVVESPISKNVEINIKEQEKPTEPVEPESPNQPVTPENPEQPTEQEKPTVSVDSKEPTKQENWEETTKGEVGLNDKKPETLPQAGSLTVFYVVGSLVILMIVGLVIINNKRK